MSTVKSATLSPNLEQIKESSKPAEETSNKSFLLSRDALFNMAATSHKGYLEVTAGEYLTISYPFQKMQQLMIPME